MLEAPIQKKALKNFAKPQTTWWKKSDIVEHPKLPRPSPKFGKQGQTDVRCWHYNLCHTLYVDSQAFLAAVNMYDRINFRLDKLVAINDDEEKHRILNQHPWTPEIHEEAKSAAQELLPDLWGEWGALLECGHILQRIGAYSHLKTKT